MVGVDTPARCAICWSVMRFDRAFTLNPSGGPAARQSNQMRNLTASLLLATDTSVPRNVPQLLASSHNCAKAPHCGYRKAYAKFSKLDIPRGVRLVRDVAGVRRRTLRG